MAIALATGDTSDTCWNRASNSGVRPSVMAHCTLPHCASQCDLDVRPMPTWKISATAPKESQKPGDEHGPGIEQQHDASASASTRDALLARPSHSASATTPTM